jgi:hypothetical protein
MQVTEQIDALYMLKTTPSTICDPGSLCCVMLPLLTVLSFVTEWRAAQFWLSRFTTSQRRFFSTPPKIFCESGT